MSIPVNTSAARHASWLWGARSRFDDISPRSAKVAQDGEAEQRAVLGLPVSQQQSSVPRAPGPATQVRMPSFTASASSGRYDRFASAS